MLILRRDWSPRENDQSQPVTEVSAKRSSLLGGMYTGASCTCLLSGDEKVWRMLMLGESPRMFKKVASKVMNGAARIVSKSVAKDPMSVVIEWKGVNMSDSEKSPDMAEKAQESTRTTGLCSEPSGSGLSTETVAVSLLWKTAWSKSAACTRQMPSAHAVREYSRGISPVLEIHRSIRSRWSCS